MTHAKPANMYDRQRYRHDKRTDFTLISPAVIMWPWILLSSNCLLGIQTGRRVYPIKFFKQNMSMCIIWERVEQFKYGYASLNWLHPKNSFYNFFSLLIVSVSTRHACYLHFRRRLPLTFKYAVPSTVDAASLSDLIISLRLCKGFIVSASVELYPF